MSAAVVCTVAVRRRCTSLQTVKYQQGYNYVAVHRVFVVMNRCKQRLYVGLYTVDDIGLRGGTQRQQSDRLFI